MATVERPIEVDPTFESILEEILSQPSQPIYGKDQHSLVSRIIHEVHHGSSGNNASSAQDAIEVTQKNFLTAVLVHRELLLKVILHSSASKDAPDHATPYIGKLTQCVRLLNLLNDTIVKLAERRREGRDEETYDLPTQVMNTFSPAIYELIEYIIESTEHNNGNLIFEDFEHSEAAAEHSSGASSSASDNSNSVTVHMIAEHDRRYFSQYSISQQRTMLLFELLRFFPACTVNWIDQSLLEHDTNHMTFFHTFFHTKTMTLRYFHHLMKVLLCKQIPNLVKFQSARLLKFLIHHKFQYFKYFGGELMEMIVSGEGGGEIAWELLCLFKQHPELIQSGLTSIAKHVHFLVTLPLRGTINASTTTPSSAAGGGGVSATGSPPLSPTSSAHKLLHPHNSGHGHSHSPMGSMSNMMPMSSSPMLHRETHSHHHMMTSSHTMNDNAGSGNGNHDIEYDYGISFLLLEYVKYRPRELSKYTDVLVSKWQTLQYYYHNNTSSNVNGNHRGGLADTPSHHRRHKSNKSGHDSHHEEKDGLTEADNASALVSCLVNYEAIFVKLAEVCPDSMISYCIILYEMISVRSLNNVVQCLGYAATGTRPLDAPDRVLPYLIELLHRYALGSSSASSPTASMNTMIATTDKPLSGLSLATSPPPMSNSHHALSEGNASTMHGTGSDANPLQGQALKQCVTTILHAIHNIQSLLSSQKLVLEQLPFLRKFANVDYYQISGIERLATMTLSEGLSTEELIGLRQSWLDAGIVTLESYEALNEVLTAAETPVVEPNDAGHVSAIAVTIQGQINKFLDAITQRLPLPKRMEVHHNHPRGRVNQEYMTLSFTCCLTGLEYSVATKQWRTWLKIGYLLMLTNRMVLDMGLGYPLDMSNEGLRSIYENFKVEAFDKEFQEFFNDPFISQAEQDELITELRHKGFYNRMSYTQYKSIGWYLFQPDIHGVEPKDITQFVGPEVDEVDENQASDQVEDEIVDTEPLPFIRSEELPSTQPDTQCGLVYDIVEMKSTWQELVSKTSVEIAPVIITAETHREPVALCKIFGYGTKQGSIMPTWKRRYFVLEHRLFTYYDDEEHYLKDSSKPAGTPFAIVPTETSIVANNNGDLIIQVNGHHRKIMLKFETEVDWILWKEAFEEHCSDDAYLRVKRQNIKKTPLFK